MRYHPGRLQPGRGRPGRSHHGGLQGRAREERDGHEGQDEEPRVQPGSAPKSKHVMTQRPGLGVRAGGGGERGDRASRHSPRGGVLVGLFERRGEAVFVAWEGLWRDNRLESAEAKFNLGVAESPPKTFFP